MTRYQNDPRIMKTKFAFTCKSCRCSVSKGEDIVYFPDTKTALILKTLLPYSGDTGKIQWKKSTLRSGSV